MNFFDREILLFINQFAQRSQVFDLLVQVIALNDLVKGVPLMTLVWWGWFKQDKTGSENREHILTTLALSVIALLIARVLSDLLPGRPRPISNPALAFRIPYGAYPYDFVGWSSFPSDHAVLFFFLSTGLLYVSRPAGLLALAYTTFVICLPRLYMGYHYPTDIISGALLGIGMACLGNMRGVKFRVASVPMRLLREKPAVFYALMFLGTYQIADLFNDVRRMSSFFYNYLTGGH